ncbi:MAG: DNA-directed RNA polymerase subunit N [archaeon]
MMIPIRCFSCGKPLASQYEEFRKRVQNGEKAEKVMDDLGIKRYCCRRMIFSQVDFIDEIGKFKR